jgi:threonine/homoserine/homoserine lactone efflux protein
MNPFDQAPLVVYIFTLTLTPGPSAFLLAASGARFGLVWCAPHLTGSLLGWVMQLLAAVLGLGAVVAENPLLQKAMMLASAAWLLWLGWCMLGRPGSLLGAHPGTKPPPATPLRWQTAAGLQLTNPKSWMTAIASAGLFVPAAAPWAKQGAFVLYAGAAGVTGLAAWALAGAALQRWLCRPSRQLALSRATAAAMAATALWGLSGVLA